MNLRGTCEELAKNLRRTYFSVLIFDNFFFRFVYPLKKIYIYKSRFPVTCPSRSSSVRLNGEVTRKRRGSCGEVKPSYEPFVDELG